MRTRQPWMVDHNEGMAVMEREFRASLAEIELDRDEAFAKSLLVDCFRHLRAWRTHANKAGVALSYEWHRAFQEAMYQFIAGDVDQADEGLRYLATITPRERGSCKPRWS